MGVEGCGVGGIIIKSYTLVLSYDDSDWLRCIDSWKIAG